jgi:hypothetical protein
MAVFHFSLESRLLCWKFRIKKNICKLSAVATVEQDSLIAKYAIEKSNTNPLHNQRQVARIRNSVSVDWKFPSAEFTKLLKNVDLWMSIYRQGISLYFNVRKVYTLSRKEILRVVCPSANLRSEIITVLVLPLPTAVQKSTEYIAAVDMNKCDCKKWNNFFLCTRLPSHLSF